MMSKPFNNGLHYPSLSPYMKEGAALPKIKHPNMNVNKEVFNRLYDHALANNQTRMIIEDLKSQQQQSSTAVLNKQTGEVEIVENRISRSPSANTKKKLVPSASANLLHKHPKLTAHNDQSSILGSGKSKTGFSNQQISFGPSPKSIPKSRLFFIQLVTIVT